MKEFLEEIWDEITDFVEDFNEVLEKRPSKGITSHTAVKDGMAIKVRPAYIFAERIENFLKFIIGLSVVISTFTASFFGITSISDLVKILIETFWGRSIMFVLGLSYMIIALWRLLHLQNDKQNKEGASMKKNRN